jgi:hypothetical protein
MSSAAANYPPGTAKLLLQNDGLIGKFAKVFKMAKNTVFTFFYHLLSDSPV